MGRLRAAPRTHSPTPKRLTASRPALPAIHRSPPPLPPVAYHAHPKHTPERAPASPAADDVSTWVPARLACFRRRSDDFAALGLSLSFSLRSPPSSSFAAILSRVYDPRTTPEAVAAAEFHDRESESLRVLGNEASRRGDNGSAMYRYNNSENSWNSKRNNVEKYNTQLSTYVSLI